MKSSVHDSQHSEVGPSGLESIMLCPGKIKMCRGLTDTKGFPAAQGTVAHTCCEKALNGWSIPKEGTIIEQDGYEIEIDAEMLTAVDVYVDHIREIREKYKTAYTIERIEQSGSLEWINLPEVYGTADYVMEIPFDTLYVRDYKHGAGVQVDVEKNPQLMTYALIASQESLLTFQRINMGIVQPRGMGKTIKAWETTPDELMAWAEDTLKPAIKLALSDTAPLVPGEKQCMWCRASSQCPAIAEYAVKTAMADFKDYASIEPDPPATLTDKQVADIYPRLNILKTWIKAIEGRVFDTVSSGGNIPGYKLVSGRKSRFWRDETQVVDVLKGLGLDPYETKLITPAKAEKALGKRKKEVQDYITAKHGKPTIVAEDDKRQAISMAAEDFKDI